MQNDTTDTNTDNDDFEIEMIRRQTIAEIAGWPPLLCKALDDSWHFTVKVHGEHDPWTFESASVVSPTIVALHGVTWKHDANHRRVELRVASIDWITEADT